MLAELLARAKGAKISAVPFNLVLGSRTARRVQNSVTLRIRPNRTLVGKTRRVLDPSAADGRGRRGQPAGDRQDDQRGWMTRRLLALPLALIDLCAGPGAGDGVREGMHGSRRRLTCRSRLQLHPPRVATAPDGTTAAAWARSDGSNSRIHALMRAAGRRPAGRRPSISGDDAGAASRTWRSALTAPQARSGSRSSRERPRALARGQHATARRRRSAQPVTVGTVGLAAVPRIAVGPDGTTIVVWTRSDGTNDIVQASVAAARRLVRDAGQPLRRRPGLEGAAGLLRRRRHGDRRVDALGRHERRSRRPASAQRADRSARPSICRSTGQNASLGSPIAFAPDGTATAVWTRGGVVQAATRPPGGAFAGPVDLSAGDGRDRRPGAHCRRRGRHRDGRLDGAAPGADTRSCRPRHVLPAAHSPPPPI